MTGGNNDNSLRSIGGHDGGSRVLGDVSLNPDDLSKYKVSKDFYRQNEVIIKQIPLEEKFAFDKSLDLFFKKFCKILIDEISSGPIKRDINSYVDHYGKENKGYLNYSEFKEIYLTHVHYGDNDMKKPEIEEGKLRALFGIFDTQSFGRVS
jgi:hypothetical protein